MECGWFVAGIALFIMWVICCWVVYYVVGLLLGCLYCDLHFTGLCNVYFAARLFILWLACYWPGLWLVCFVARLFIYVVNLLLGCLSHGCFVAGCLSHG